MKYILEAVKVNKTYEIEKQQSTILKGIDLQVKEGELVAIMGQSGSGKSTLLYGISGMDQITSGKVLFGGENIAEYGTEKMSRLRLENMGFIFQNTHFLKSLTIEDNILLPGIKACKLSRAEVINRCDKLMHKMGISQIATHDIAKVSGGQLQRAAICRALINEPELLFADEPTGALNQGATNEVVDILNTINEEGTTIVLVTHDAKVAARAERVIFLADGEIQSELIQGKYTKELEKERENRMNEWLCQNGF